MTKAEALALNITKAELRRYLRTAAGMAAFLARWTSTPKDDAVASLFAAVIEDDADFDKLCDIFGVTEA